MDADTCNSNNDKCTCEGSDQPKENIAIDEESTSKERKSKISLTSFAFSLRRGRSLNLTGKRSKKNTQTTTCPNTSKKSPKWVMKLNCSKKEPKGNETTNSCCQCTCYRRTGEHHLPPPVVVTDTVSTQSNESSSSAPVAPAPVNEQPQARVEEINEALNRGVYSNSSGNIILSAPFVDIQWIRSIHEDCDEAARIQRAREIEQGVEAPANFRPLRRVQLLYSDIETEGGQAPRRLQLVCPPDLTVESLRAFFQNRITLRSCPLDTITGCHTQVDFIHCLVPDLLNITNCSFYWGKMDRYEAERLLDGKPEGTFLLRDSAQEEFLFSVSFRKYGRSLHARIEQWNHKFSFDSHDPGVYTSDTVCGLIEHYKDPSSCMFFEPMLTWPLHRNFTFSLQHLCRAVVVSKLEYDNINQLQLPKSLKSYLKEYHYRQKVRVERFDDDVQWLDLRNVPP
ncbi:hypothetical protein RN001_015448 [Aquatica leii]|uniref:Suppressor of cytokine signaling 5 n=1 Tax=Aquatica leii TaxID=1421715 RepID=A0AAN7SDC8_9COLE|nr:hypothetical protein RN001_015448 [Aquatica leii]